MVEHLAGFKDRTAAETVFAVIQPRAHDHDVLLGGIGMAEHVAQVVEVAGITHRNQDIARPHSHGAAAQFLIAVHAELIHALHLPLALVGNTTFRIREDDEEQHAERDAADGCLPLGEQIHNGSGKQHRGNEDDAHRYFALAEVHIPGNLP